MCVLPMHATCGASRTRVADWRGLAYARVCARAHAYVPSAVVESSTRSTHLLVHSLEDDVPRVVDGLQDELHALAALRVRLHHQVLISSARLEDAVRCRDLEIAGSDP